jgi:5-methylthioribose kinase
LTGSKLEVYLFDAERYILGWRICPTIGVARGFHDGLPRGRAALMGEYVAGGLRHVDLGVDPEEQKRRGPLRNPELCTITEDLSSRSPTERRNSSCRQRPDAAAGATTMVRDGHAKWSHDPCEALIHADLHTGSVMVCGVGERAR